MASEASYVYILSIIRQVNFNRAEIGGKCQNSKSSNATFCVIFKQCGHCVGQSTKNASKLSFSFQQIVRLIIAADTNSNSFYEIRGKFMKKTSVYDKEKLSFLSVIGECSSATFSFKATKSI